MRIATSALSAALVIAGIGSVLAAEPATNPANPPPQQQAALGNAATTPAPGMKGGIDRSGDRYTAALNFLEANGYTGISNFAADGQNFDATAWHKGHQVSVVTNPDTKLIENHG